MTAASDDEIVRVLRVVPQDEVTALVRRRGELAVARFFARPVRRALDAAVAAHVTGGAACAELPPVVAARLDGYRARAALGALPGVPDVLGGGVRRVKLHGLAPLAVAYGNAYVAVRAYPGSPLPEVVGELAPDARRATLAAIARIVAALHARGVAHGALGPAAFAAAGAAPTLVDLGPLRAVDAAAGAIDADRAAVAAIAGWLLGDDAPDAAALDALARAAAPSADGTVAVPDEPADGTVFVPDE